MACSSSSPSKAGLENEPSSPGAQVLDETCEAHLLDGPTLAQGYPMGWLVDLSATCVHLRGVLSCPLIGCC